MTCRAVSAAGVLAFALLGSGCGTFNNLTRYGPPGEDGVPEPPSRQIYGGVRGEWAELRRTSFDDVCCLNLIFLPLYAIDLPLSAIGDTLTLPVTVSAEVVRGINRHYFPPEPPKADTPDE